jgi:hypothetical protein
MEPVSNKEPEPVFNIEPTGGFMRTVTFPLLPTAGRKKSMMAWCHVKDFLRVTIRRRNPYYVWHYTHNTKGPLHKEDEAIAVRGAGSIRKAEDERIFNEMCKAGMRRPGRKVNKQRRGHKVGENAI